MYENAPEEQQVSQKQLTYYQNTWKLKVYYLRDFCCQDIILFIIKILAELQMVLKLNCVHHFDCIFKLSQYWDLKLKRFTGIYRLHKIILSITHLMAYFVLKM